MNAQSPIERLTNWAQTYWVEPYAERSTDTEWLDDLRLGGAELRTSLLEIARVNTWTGGQSAAVRSVRTALAQIEHVPGEPLRIVDAGCGSGDGLRAIARWARRTGVPMKLIGVDANQHTLALAKELSIDYPEISYRCLDVFGREFQALDKDIIVSALFCHHFPTPQIREWIVGLRGTVKCLVINDLQRHVLPSYLFRALCLALGVSPMTLHDGLVSIKRSFRRAEWQALLAPIAPGRYTISWRWAFRYEVVITP